uniref:Uncharacterized protein n=1 Tax=Cacopsylla melanoneura TaxID=428564 RepID=A0A8D8RCK5_9HEMI
MFDPISHYIQTDLTLKFDLISHLSSIRTHTKVRSDLTLKSDRGHHYCMLQFGLWMCNRTSLITYVVRYGRILIFFFIVTIMYYKLVASQQKFLYNLIILFAMIFLSVIVLIVGIAFCF